ncbi:thioredoxin reductase [Naviculisporaceae sp. PSN 640]
MRFLLVLLLASLVYIVSGAAIQNKLPVPIHDNLFETIIVGGGPAGLAALSALGRVRRKALLIDSGEYRNGPTRHMHDVLGYDGVTPAYFRYKAREQISHYSTVSFTNGTVTKITSEVNPSNPDASFFVVETTTSDSPSSPLHLFTRKVILATGLVDVLPSTPGLAENFGKGIYWCPWCDGHEHADQPMGLLCSLDSVVDNFREIITLNSDVIAFVNGTDTPDNRKLNDKSFPGWEKYLNLHNVRIDNRTIAAISRLKNGSDREHDPSLPSTAEYDLFNVEFKKQNGKNEPEVEQRAVFFTGFPTTLRGDLGTKTGVQMYSPGRLGVDQNMQTNIDGIYAVGDANSDNSTNVPHAMYSGKRAVVFIHQKLAKEDSELEVKRLPAVRWFRRAKRGASQFDGLDARSIWIVVNGKSHEDDVLYAGECNDEF